MENTHLLSLLVLWLNFMVQVIPLRLASTYMELLIGVKGEILFQKAQSPISKRRTGHCRLVAVTQPEKLDTDSFYRSGADAGTDY